MAKGKKTEAPKTSAQRLDSIVKSARKIMRKDKGLNGDLDRLPMLTWIMFLKFLDDLERMHKDEAAMAGKKFHPAIEAPYRWRDWAAQDDGITGPDLISFISDKEAVRPDGTRGPGLFAYLRDLRGRNGGRDRRDVIATAFKGLSNRMESGYLLRDVVNLVDDIHFNSSEEIHTLSRLYEGLLREMRDAAGDSGEFYTPRSIVRLMVQLADPKLGEMVMDPACGTGGFLAEAFSHLERQANTVEKRKVLQDESIKGGEAKSLPYLLAQMNLLLHGLEAPDIDPGNSLRFRLSEMGDKDRVDVILTNPPFGGEEETGILTNFPEDQRATETSLLFMQLIMRRLKRGGKGRAAIVVPNGFLFGDGVAARIKTDMLAHFNLHTIIRLPEGVFAPYTLIATNILFFDTSGATEDIWFWEHQVPEGRKKYSKTQPLQDDELADCITWWKKRKEGPQAWKAKAVDLIKRDDTGQIVSVNLDMQNPTAKNFIDHRSPDEIMETVMGKEQRVLSLLAEMRKLVVQEGKAYREIIANAPRVPMKDVAPLVRRAVVIDPDEDYPELGVRSFGKGTFHKPTLKGMAMGQKEIFQIEGGDLIINLTFAWEGAIAVAKPEDGGRYASHRFLTFKASPNILVDFLRFYWLSNEGMARLIALSPGSAGRNRVLSLKKVLDEPVPVPNISAQKWFVSLLGLREEAYAIQGEASVDCNRLLASLLDHAFNGEVRHESD